MLNVTETKVYRWIDEEEIPFVMIHHHATFDRVELLEWAMAMELPVSVDLYEDDHDQPFTAALERGGGRALVGSLGDLAADLPLKSDERAVVGAMLAARESEMFVTRSADWIAIPKARSPIICPQSSSMVMWWWCGHRARMINDVPTNVLFLVVAPTIKQHLQLVSRLSHALHDTGFCTAVQRNSAFDQIVAEARRWELALELESASATPTSHGAAR